MLRAKKTAPSLTLILSRQQQSGFAGDMYADSRGRYGRLPRSSMDAIMGYDKTGFNQFLFELYRIDRFACSSS